MTKKLFSILLALSLVFGFTAAVSLESSASGVVDIYESLTDPVIDGVIDEGAYRFVCATGNDPAGNIVTWPDCRVDDTMELYACWKGDFLYLAVKVVCNEPHIAYRNDATGHFIFNAHYMMTCLCPDNPYKDEYLGDNDDGSWSWTALYNAGFVYEWTMINPSQESDSDIADHFRDMSAKAGFEYKVATAGGYDIYEQKIPLSQVTTNAAPTGIKGEVGALFGFGFAIGLSDHGFGYADKPEEWPDYIDHDDMVYYSDYFTGDKNIRGLAYCKLMSDLEKDPDDEQSEAPAPTAIDTPYDIFPQLDGLWTMTENGGQNVAVTYSQGKTVINGSTVGNWPAATAKFPSTVYIGEGGYLVYDFSFETGLFSLRMNGTNYVHQLMTDNCEDGSGDMLPGTYKGAISYEQLAELLGTTEDGLVAITDMTVFSVSGAEITFNAFRFDPSYVPSDVPEVSEPEVSEPAESTPEDEESVDDNVSSTVTDNSDVSDTDDDNGGNLGLIIGIAVAAVAIIAVVAAVLVLKKKK